MPARSAVRASSLGASQRDATQSRNARVAWSRVTWKGSSALGLIRRLDSAVLTMAVPQNGHLLATTLAAKWDSAPQPTHLTVIVSTVSADDARLFSVAR